ncbi:hypothetical protein ACHAPJ_006286 [Fusarium lateritium]
MGTKTPAMVRNHYVRQKDQVKPGWETIVQEVQRKKEKREFQPPLFLCKQPGCEVSIPVYSTKQALQQHILEEHTKPREDPMKELALGLEPHGSIKRKPISEVGKADSLGFVHDLPDKVQDADLRNALAAFGELFYFLVHRQGKFAMIQYKTPQSYQAAAAANPHAVNGETISVEASRPKPSTMMLLSPNKREAHRLQGHGITLFLSPLEGCERAVPGNGFLRHLSVLDHMKRVHNYHGSSSGSPATGSSQPGKGGEAPQTKMELVARSLRYTAVAFKRYAIWRLQD